MTLSGVQISRYTELATDILDKILITSRRAFGYVVKTLKKVVLELPTKPPKRHIPQEIIDRATQVKNLLSESNVYIPMERKKRANPQYRRQIGKQRAAFVHLIQDVVRDRIRTLQFMPLAKQKELIQQNRKKLITLQEAKARTARAEELRLQRQQQLLDYPEEKDSAEKDEYNMPKIEWRIHLLEPMEREDDVPMALNMDEVGRIAHLIDCEKYPEAQALQLPQSFYIAKWLGSEEIYNLIFNDKLIATPDQDLLLLTSPTDNQMRRLSLLSPFILQGVISVKDALENYLDADGYTLLDDPDFKTRVKEKNLNANDLFILETMGITFPRTSTPKLLQKHT